jgi:DNA-binding PadR family transcriptional regulator
MPAIRTFYCFSPNFSREEGKIDCLKFCATFITMSNREIDYTQEDYWIKLINQSLVRFYILKALKDKDLHGYMLIQEISKLSNDFCSPSESTLYPALAQLKAAGLIQQTNPKDRSRKTYHLTQKGRDAFKTAAKTWNRVLPNMGKNTIL